MTGLKVTHKYDLSERYGIDFSEVFAQAVADHADWRNKGESLWQARYGLDTLTGAHATRKAQAEGRIGHDDFEGDSEAMGAIEGGWNHQGGFSRRAPGAAGPK